MKNNEIIILDPNISIHRAINKISKNSKKTKFPGIAIICKRTKLLGIVTDGDIRRAYSSGIDFNLSIKKIMNTEPISLPDDTPIQNIVTLTRTLVANSNKFTSDHVKYVITTDKNNNFKKLYDYSTLISNDVSSKRTVTVIGMGYVGLTLAVSLSSRGHLVTGVDIDEKVIKNLNNGKTDIFEPGLNKILKSNLKSKKIKFINRLDNVICDIYIVGVGTPIKNNKPNLKFIKQAINSISKQLKRGDHVMLRSTVPAGTTRNIIIKILEKQTKLLAGKDFFVSFTPERTIEGNALYELRNLPQIIGGYTPGCVKSSSDFWSTLTNKIIKVDSLEAAELIKLANNTFRDLSFAFSNELAMKCSKFNINSFSLISAANDGYPRNQIPSPSPGVGGSCLTKDPILYSSNYKGLRYQTLGTKGREINKKASMYVIDILKKYSKKIKLPLKKMNILIVGLAFKGEPDNYDLRESVSVKIFQKLEHECKNLFLWDAVIKNNHKLINKKLITNKNLKNKLHLAHAILILNNNKMNIKILDLINNEEKKLIFDGWHQLDQAEIEKNKNFTYSTMGYLSN